MLAADMGTGLPAIIADGVDQRFARLDPDRIIAAVDIERDVGFFVHSGSLEHFSPGPNPLTPSLSPLGRGSSQPPARSQYSQAERAARPSLSPEGRGMG